MHESPSELEQGPASLLAEVARLFVEGAPPGPVLDLACGDGRNGIFLARMGVPVICCDRSPESLERVRTAASLQGVKIRTRQVDLEATGANPLQEEAYAGVIVFRYLHRPLIPCIRKAIRAGGILVYETFTTRQPEIGKPHSPRFLLEPGELALWFKGWETIHYFEGIKERPRRAVAQIVCRKPA